MRVPCPTSVVAEHESTVSPERSRIVKSTGLKERCHKTYPTHKRAPKYVRVIALQECTEMSECNRRLECAVSCELIMLHDSTEKTSEPFS